MPITEEDLDALISEAVDKSYDKAPSRPSKRDKRLTRSATLPGLAAATRRALKETFGVPEYVKEGRLPSAGDLASRAVAPLKAAALAGLTGADVFYRTTVGVPSAIAKEVLDKVRERDKRFDAESSLKDVLYESLVRSSPGLYIATILKDIDVPKTVVDEVRAAFGVGERGPSEAGDVFRSMGLPEPVSAVAGLAAESPVLTGRAVSKGVRLLSSKLVANKLQKLGLKALAAADAFHRFVLENLPRFPNEMAKYAVDHIDEIMKHYHEYNKFIKTSRRLGLRNVQSATAKTLQDILDSAQKGFRETADSLFNEVRTSVVKSPRKLDAREGRLLANEIRKILREDQALRNVVIKTDSPTKKFSQTETFYVVPTYVKGERKFKILKEVVKQHSAAPAEVDFKKSVSAKVFKRHVPVKSSKITLNDLPPDIRARAQEVIEGLQRSVEGRGSAAKRLKLGSISRTSGGKKSVTLGALAKQLENYPKTVSNADLMDAYMAVRDSTKNNQAAERLTALLAEHISPELVRARELWKHYNDVIRDVELFGKVVDAGVGSSKRKVVSKLANTSNLLFDESGLSPEQLRAMALRAAKARTYPERVGVEAQNVLDNLMRSSIVDEAVETGTRPRLSALTIGGGAVSAASSVLLGMGLGVPFRTASALAGAATLGALAGTVPKIALRMTQIGKKASRGVYKMLGSPVARASASLADAYGVKAVLQAAAASGGSKRTGGSERRNEDIIDADAVASEILSGL